MLSPGHSVWPPTRGHEHCQEQKEEEGEGCPRGSIQHPEPPPLGRVEGQIEVLQDVASLEVQVGSRVRSRVCMREWTGREGGRGVSGQYRWLSVVQWGLAWVRAL
jgi:hypothetical protein